MTDEPCTEINCSVQTHPASEGHIDGPGELERRLRAELSLTQRAHSDAIYALGQIADAYGIPFPDADAFFLIEEMPGVARSRVAEHTADMAALARVRELRDRWRKYSSLTDGMRRHDCCDNARDDERIDVVEALDAALDGA